MNHVRTERTHFPGRSNELGAKKSRQKKPRAPRAGDFLRHVARVCESLESLRRVSKSLDVDTADILTRGKVLTSGGDHLHFDIDFAKRDGKPVKKRSRGVADESRERMREKENSHLAQGSSSESLPCAISSIRALSSRVSARCAATSSPTNPVEKNTLPRMRQV